MDSFITRDALEGSFWDVPDGWTAFLGDIPLDGLKETAEGLMGRSQDALIGYVRALFEMNNPTKPSLQLADRESHLA